MYTLNFFDDLGNMFSVNEKPPTEGMLDSDNQESLMDKFKNAFDSILNIIQFIF